MRESESLLIGAQNNAIKTVSKQELIRRNKNSRCRLCGYRDAMINHIISEWSKLAQREYKTSHDRVGEVID